MPENFAQVMYFIITFAMLTALFLIQNVPDMDGIHIADALLVSACKHKIPTCIIDCRSCLPVFQRLRSFLRYIILLTQFFNIVLLFVSQDLSSK